MSYYTRQQNRRRSEATEQETLIQWCEWQQASHPELKLIYHIPNGGSRNTSAERMTQPTAVRPQGLRKRPKKFSIMFMARVK